MLKTGICKSLTRKPSYSSFFSAWCTDLKNVIFEKIHWAPSEVVGQEVIFEAKFWISSSFNKFSFRIFVILDFEVVWPRWPQWPQKRHTQIFWKWPQMIANFPKINGRYESKVEVALKPNVFSSEECGMYNFSWKEIPLEKSLNTIHQKIKKLWFN